jgi:hypothetical protein
MARMVLGDVEDCCDVNDCCPYASRHALTAKMAKATHVLRIVMRSNVVAGKRARKVIRGSSYMR